MAKATLPSLSNIQFLYQLQVRPLNPAKDNLRYPVTMLKLLWLHAKVYQNYFYLAPVIAVDGSRSVKTGNTLFYG